MTPTVQEIVKTAFPVGDITELNTTVLFASKISGTMFLQFVISRHHVFHYEI